MWESVIFTVYWTILFPSDIPRLTTPAIWFNDFLEHFFPLFCLSIEWSLNRIYIEKNQVYVNMIVFLLYGLINITVTYVTGKPVYDPISWDSFTAWLLGLAMLPLALGFYMLLYVATRGKFRCLGMQ